MTEEVVAVSMMVVGGAIVLYYVADMLVKMLRSRR